MAGINQRCWILIICIHIWRTSARPNTDFYQSGHEVSKRRTEDDLAIVEDDIKLTNIDPYESVKEIWLRSAVTDKAKVWTDGIVPFYVDETFFNRDELEIIQAAIEEFHSKTCVRFVPRTTQMPYLFITPLSRCWSEIGMPPKEGIRTLSLGPACLQRRGTVIHELMHVLGFWHEQNRVDRDDYITINWENIREGLQHNFLKYDESKVDTLQEPYDYQSIMHYSSYAFTKDPQRQTILPKIPVMIGQRFGLSPLDVKKIEKLYGCSSTSLPAIQFQENSQHPAKLLGGATEQSDGKETAASFVFPDITELVPLPFKFDWRKTTAKPNPEIVFPNR